MSQGVYFIWGFKNTVLNYKNYLGWTETPIPYTKTFYESKQIILEVHVLMKIKLKLFLRIN
jgi:hypothetical protein